MAATSRTLGFQFPFGFRSHRTHRGAILNRKLLRTDLNTNQAMDIPKRLLYRAIPHAEPDTSGPSRTRISSAPAKKPRVDSEPSMMRKVKLAVGRSVISPNWTPTIRAVRGFEVQCRSPGWDSVVLVSHVALSQSTAFSESHATVCCTVAFRFRHRARIPCRMTPDCRRQPPFRTALYDHRDRSVHRPLTTYVSLWSNRRARQSVDERTKLDGHCPAEREAFSA